MTPLHRKLLRDLWSARAQAATIAVVVACGVAAFVSSVSTYRSLRASMDAYYAASRFPDVFASLERAPESLAARIAEVPGVQAVETRVSEDVTLQLPQVREPILGRLVSIPEGGDPQLSLLTVRKGRRPAPGRDDEVVLSEAFAEAHGLGPGDVVHAVVNGKREALQVVGVGSSPEWVFVVPPGGLPDDRRYGVLWRSREALAAAFDMEGAFDDLVLTLSHGASEPEVLEAVDRLLDPYGGRGAYGRADQPSHRFLDDEIAENQAMAVVLPPIFLGVAAFLLNVVLSRMVAAQRSQIATLKALGYGGREVGVHFLQLVLVILATGVALGVGLGAFTGRALTLYYLEFFRLPLLTWHLDPWVPLSAGALAIGAGVAATLGAVRRVTRLPPAEAMRPESPGVYRRGRLSRVTERLPVRVILVARAVVRRPLRAAFTSLGVAFAVAVMLASLFFFDAVDYALGVQFGQVRRDDLTVVFAGPVSARARGEIAHLPGVLSTEGIRTVPVRLEAGHRSRRSALQGVDAGADLRRALAPGGRTVAVPPEGVLLAQRVARELRVGRGDTVRVELLEGDLSVHRLEVVGYLSDLAGVEALLDRRALHRLLGEAPTVTEVAVQVDPTEVDALMARLRERPEVISVTIRKDLLASFRELVAEVVTSFTLILSLFAAAISVGVVYNAARIAFQERARELASLRVLGFTRGEAGEMLLGELLVEFLVGLPLGFLIGYGLAGAATAAFSSETLTIPLVIYPGTYLISAGVVTVAAAFSALAVRRMLDRFDLISVLKSYE